METQILQKITTDNFRLIGKRVLIKKDPDKETTESGLIVPYSATRELLDTGTILQVSEKANVNLKIGQRISFERGAGTQLGEDKNILILNVGEILGVY